jgi:multiple sugar transport system permease protein
VIPAADFVQAAPGRATVARRRFVRRATPYLFILPALLALGAFIAYPVGYSFWLSFRDYQLNMPILGKPWVGLENYRRLPDDEALIASIQWTITFAAITVPVGFVLGLAMALVLNSSYLGVARGVLRGVFLLPMMLAGIVAGFMWRMLFDPEYGPINHIIGLLGFDRISWFGDLRAAKAAVIITELWLSTPFVMLVLIAGLQGIPDDYLEAARIDGASALQSFFQIVLPLLRPAIAIVVVIRTMDALRAFDVIYALTNGGPGTETATVMFYNYRYFSYFQMGRASALSFTVLIAIALITLVYLWLMKPAQDQDR